MEQTQPLLSMQHIRKTFPGVVALDDVHFTLERGSIHALLGENGAGKSTLIKVLTGVEKRDAGTVTLGGKEIFPKSAQEAQELGVSTVYQEVNLCPNLSVAENVFIGRAPGSGFKIDWKTMNKRAEELLRRFDLSVDVTRPLSCYPVAAQQMVAIARAVDISAKVLILDEPTSSLSVVEVEKLFAIMRKLSAEGMGIIFVTHFLEQVYEVSDTITVLRDGKYVGTYATAELPRVQLVAKMIGKEYAAFEGGALFFDGAEQKRELLLRLNRVSLENSVEDLDLDVRKGEVLGFSGLLGSGRSETARAIFGVDRITGGTFTLKGKPLELKDPIDGMRKGFAFCPENRKTEGIIGELSLRDNIALALQAKKGMFKKLPRAEANRLAERYIAELSIKTPSDEQFVHNLSGGNQQKVILARWLATDPELLILDEPTRGIDVGTKAEIQKIVVTLAHGGMALVFISSEIDEMLRCCSRIVVLRDRKKVAELGGEQISERTIMEHIAGGEPK
ncbi:MAG TPA: sugar ABC transporter ATP-binding protein [Feifaniaceae bacterium]|nr:sugar ABC transporter ATP-binding protein [Feifaniaceae bacterium]